MAKKRVLVQGFTSQTHSSALNVLLATPDIQRVILGSAFVSESGVKLIEEKLKHHSANLDAFVGIRNAITSMQGLERLRSIGCKLYTVDTGSWQKLFHPKLYYVRSTAVARILIGSANLTLGGLNNNIEAGIFVDLDLGVAADLDEANALETLFDSLPTDHPQNIVAIKTFANIAALRAAGLIADESLVGAPQIHPPKQAGTVPPSTTPPIKLKTVPISVLGTKLKPKGKAQPALAVGLKRPMGPHSYEYVWRSRGLRPSNINVFTSATAAKKNVLSLGQGGFEKKIAFQNYFRVSVFGGLAWTPAETADVFEATADFEFVLAGVNYGVFKLRIRYSQSAATVNQNNVTTRLVWGDLLPLVSHSANLGRIAYLFRDVADPTRFLLEID